MILYFSGTGNSRYVAHSLALALGESCSPLLSASCEDLDREGETKLGIVFPVYAWGIPYLVAQHLRDLLAASPCRYSYVYAICTCGDDMGYTDKALRGLFADLGWPLHAFGTLVMPETYVVLPGFYLDKQASVANKLRQTDVQLSAWVSAIQQQAPFEKVVRGRFPKLKSGLLRRFFQRFLVRSTFFTCQQQCMGCGKCVQVCPTQNIVLDAHERPRWGNHCTGCLACYHHCPVNAVQYLFSQHKGQYHPPVLSKKTETT